MHGIEVLEGVCVCVCVWKGGGGGGGMMESFVTHNKTY